MYPPGAIASLSTTVSVWCRGCTNRNAMCPQLRKVLALTDIGLGVAEVLDLERLDRRCGPVVRFSEKSVINSITWSGAALVSKSNSNLACTTEAHRRCAGGAASRGQQPSTAAQTILTELVTLPWSKVRC